MLLKTIISDQSLGSMELYYLSFVTCKNMPENLENKDAPSKDILANFASARHVCGLNVGTRLRHGESMFKHHHNGLKYILKEHSYFFWYRVFTRFLHTHSYCDDMKIEKIFLEFKGVSKKFEKNLRLDRNSWEKEYKPIERNRN